MKGWTLFPLWGLEMAENGFGLDSPVFDDATIVAPSFLKRFAPPDATAQALFSGTGLRELLEAGGTEMVGAAPTAHLLEVPPAAFIAVRRRDPEDALRYAESIRALLTGSLVLTSGQAKGVSLTPLPLHWSAAPSLVRLADDGSLQTERRVIVNSFVHLTPLLVTHKMMRDSWERGAAIVGTWKLHRESPLSKALVGSGATLTGLRRRIRDAASMLARAMESTDPSLSTLIATVALESLLKGATSFEEREEMAGSVFSSASGPSEISRLFSNRHKVAHEGMAPQNEAQHSQEIAAAWGVILMAATAAEDLSSVEDFLDHLRGRVLARRVAVRLRKDSEEALADQIERVATKTKRGQGA